MLTADLLLQKKKNDRLGQSNEISVLVRKAFQFAIDRAIALNGTEVFANN